MADKKISALTSASTPLAGTEVLPIVQSGATVKVSVENVLTSVQPSGVANSVVYLNGSKVATTGGVLLFDGTNLGVGTTPAYRADVVSPAGAQNIFRAGQSGVSNGLTISSTGSTLSYQFDTGGIVVSGSTQTDGLVSHAGTGGAYQSNKFNLQWTGSAALWVDGTNIGNLATVSDYRIKRNIASQTESGLAKVMQLRPVVYQLANYNNLFVASDEIKEGFIAHELQEVIPSAVSGQKDAEDQIQSLKLDAVCAVLAKAIQEQQAQIEALKADVAALKGV
jgi:hypothetical protein